MTLNSADLLKEVGAQLGITRLGSATDLDGIGIPVWFAVRPNSRGLSVSQGKGVDDEHARMSALMESIECAVAERPNKIVSKIGSIDELTAEGCDIVDFQKLARCRHYSLDNTRERGWVKGVNLLTGGDIYCPFELVGLDYRTRTLWDRSAFTFASIGMGAGPSMPFAARHALLELIEIDVSGSFTQFGLQAGNADALLIDPGVNKQLDKVLARCKRVGISAEFVSIRSSFSIPTIGAFISRSVATSSGIEERMVGGFASRPYASEAALAALLEAIQSRLTEIMGSRDDLAAQDYMSGAKLTSGKDPVHLTQLENTAQTDLDWRGISAKISAVTSAPVYLFELNSGFKDLHVIRALAPGLKFDHGLNTTARIEDIPIAISA